jgi:hypothetical protein
MEENISKLDCGCMWRLRKGKRYEQMQVCDEHRFIGNPKSELAELEKEMPDIVERMLKSYAFKNLELTKRERAILKRKEEIRKELDV